MSWFTFEIFRAGEAPAASYVRKLSDNQEIWPQVETIALLIKDNGKSLIRVKNPAGETVIRTGVATALTSIEECSCITCPLKRELERKVLGVGHTTALLAGDRLPCERRDRLVCKRGVDGASGAVRSDSFHSLTSTSLVGDDAHRAFRRGRLTASPPRAPHADQASSAARIGVSERGDMRRCPAKSSGNAF